MSLWGLIYLLLSLTVAGLAAVALYLWWQVWRQQQAQRAQQAARVASIHESLDLLAQSLLQGQVRVAEASIRIAVLAGHLPLDDHARQQLAPVFAVHERISHIPTHDRWNALPSKERRAYERELAAVEQDYVEQVTVVCRWLRAGGITRESV